MHNSDIVLHHGDCIQIMQAIRRSLQAGHPPFNIQLIEQRLSKPLQAGMF
jgi:hypothetical protein